MPRFDEVELQPAPVIDVPSEIAIDQSVAPAIISPALPESRNERAATVVASTPASLFRRGLAILTDLSLFVALTLALAPLLPDDAAPAEIWSAHPAALISLVGFVIVLSYYYFVGSWLLWGKTLGGAIFDVKVVGAETATMPFRSANRRWLGVALSLLTVGVGFLMAVLPSRRSLSDRISQTRCVMAG
jgi:uncharacterized RDD family membrane protein YckC